MRLPRLPGLPVSRRRHEAEVERVRRREHDEWQGFHSRQARFWRERVAELEQSIRQHQRRVPAVWSDHDVRLYAVLDGHDRQERDTRAAECVERWPECETGAYDPRCCRFPKSCSADVHYDRQERGDEPDGPVDFEGDSVDVDADQGGRLRRRQPETTDVGPPDNSPEPTRVCQVAEHADAERIVGDLARPNPGLPLGGGDGVECRYCESRWTLWERHALSLHDRECVWRRAVEHVRPHERGDEPVTYQDGERYRVGEYAEPLRGDDGDH